MPDNNFFLVQYGTASRPNQLGLEESDMLLPLQRAAATHDKPLQLDWLLSDHPDAPRAADLLRALQGNVQMAVDKTTITPQAPVGRQEIWAAGVTYKRSEEARELESNNSTIYSRVYNATRPELFFKAMGYDALGMGQPVGIRFDARWSVPEPELVVVMNAHMEVVGFTIGNDMSSRDIEGENPLYLPQAKVYEASCALGPRIWLQPGRTTWPEAKIEMEIERAGKVVFGGETSTAAIHRPLAELIEYLGRCKRFPYGAMLFTGTGIVPPDDFGLAEGDQVRIRIDPIGELVNTVRVVGKRIQETTKA
ncbi:MAG: fumarylacetoacetate hydrolase family protein [Anaerolineae bacterium]|nr:fumarylacetoacetate hydrolase family protein [Anaerolineae bacterium]